MKYRRQKPLKRRFRTVRVRDSRMTLKDRVLALRLFWTFERDLALASVQGIHFYVQSGIVTLHGTIRHELDRDLLVSIVRGIAGVKEVVDHLHRTDTIQAESLSEITLHL